MMALVFKLQDQCTDVVIAGKPCLYYACGHIKAVFLILFYQPGSKGPIIDGWDVPHKSVGAGFTCLRSRVLTRPTIFR